MVVLMLLVSACRTAGSNLSESDPDVPVRRLAGPSGSLAAVAWLPDGRLYLDRAADGGSETEIWSVPARGGAAQRLRLPAQPGCWRTDYLHSAALPDGRLGLTRLCWKDPPIGDTGAVDPHTRRYVPLAELGPLNPSAVTWQKDLRSGFLSRTSGSCAGIAELTAAGPRRWTAPAALDGRTWELDGYVFARGTLDCTRWGRADLPVLSPDGTSLYFLASPESFRISGGVRREETPWRLYRWALSGTRPTGQPEELTADLGKPLDLVISSDGLALAFAGQRDGSYGLWWVDPRSRQVRRLSGGKYVSASFSPDGRHLAAIFQRDGDHGVLEVLDMP
jgi:WD40-like Beta Propeller Repeat